MSYPAEAQIAREIFKFVASGLLYRGSKPVMWSVVEKTALAEGRGRIRRPYQRHDFLPRSRSSPRTPPWSSGPRRPGQFLAIARSPSRAAFLTGAIESWRPRPTTWAKVGATYLLAQSLAESVFDAAKVTAFEFLGEVKGDALASMVCALPLHAHGYGLRRSFARRRSCDRRCRHGFVHTAPGHGREDFELWTASTRLLQERGVDPRIPYTVDENGALTDEAPGFEGKRVINDKGNLATPTKRSLTLLSRRARLSRAES